MSIMTNDIFEEIDRLHSECSLLDKASKIAYLRGRLQHLNNIAYQMTLYLRGKVGITDEERSKAMWLINEINAVENEGQKATREFIGEGVQNLLKQLLK